MDFGETLPYAWIRDLDPRRGCLAKTGIMIVIGLGLGLGLGLDLGLVLGLGLGLGSGLVLKYD